MTVLLKDIGKMPTRQRKITGASQKLAPVFCLLLDLVLYIGELTQISLDVVCQHIKENSGNILEIFLPEK